MKKEAEGWRMHFWAHLKTVGRHRRLVRKYCFRLGLYRQGLLHDLSKYSPAEFLVGIRYYQGNRSPNDAERRDRGYSTAWLHHKGRNRHHLEYWTDYNGRGGGVVGVEMPVKYVAEMFCDRLAASRVYRGDEYRQSDPWEFFQRSQKHTILHDNSKALLEDMLVKLRDEGEDAAFAYIRTEILGKRGCRRADKS